MGRFFSLTFEYLFFRPSFSKWVDASVIGRLGVRSEAPHMDSFKQIRDIFVGLKPIYILTLLTKTHILIFRPIYNI